MVAKFVTSDEVTWLTCRAGALDRSVARVHPIAVARV
jgi:hypothetical protein